MPRKKCLRQVAHHPDVIYYKPAGIPMRDLQELVLHVEELEALRLADLEGLYQEAAAEKMEVSRATFGRIIGEARQKIAKALIQGMAIRIEGGSFKMRIEEKT